MPKQAVVGGKKVKMGGVRQRAMTTTLPKLIQSLRKECPKPRMKQLPSLRRSFSLYDQINLIDNVPEDHLRFQGYTDTGFRVNGVEYEGSLLCVGNLLTSWAPSSFSHITPDRSRLVSSRLVSSLPFHPFFFVFFIHLSNCAAFTRQFTIQNRIQVMHEPNAFFYHCKMPVNFVIIHDKVLWQKVGLFQCVPIPVKPLEILILGCGRYTQPVDPELRRFIRSTGMKLEAVDSRNAASTYNILNEEGRLVAAALLPYGVSS
ncbi:hypothetical protein SADUNF_Sadunf14G0137000 [Salix dunnii]|uniref:NADH dehydrogenase [ubiquinone] 1 alpha subcomplex assembly factor 3 n=1 Tax=Salix dunnii TaxID=1413687 RepID=A0A835ML56_9ROSI|nr:hypothetical protein SADUNF_Sadunf14G0137000 [Salix dunnii]